MAVNNGIYDPANVNLIVQARDIKGFGEETFIETERADENEALTKVGAKGDFTFVINKDKSGDLIFRLQQNTPDNAFLQSLKEAKSIFACAVTHNGQLKELVAAPVCMIKVAPRMIFGKDETEREWRITAGELIETAKII